MSLKLMAAAWEANIPSTEKMVLLCLCDFASDSGVCWPSVKTIAGKCSMSDRTVQGAIKRLRELGFCSWNDTPGKPHQFRLDPRRICTPEEFAPPKNLQKPPQNLRPTPAESSDEPIKNHQEPSNSNNPRARKPVVPRPSDVEDQVWSDFNETRKTKLTLTALKGIKREADKAGWTLNDALAEAAARGWQSFKAEWVKEQTSDRPNRQRSSSPTGIAAALDRRIEPGGFTGQTGRPDAGGSRDDCALPPPAVALLR